MEPIEIKQEKMTDEELARAKKLNFDAGADGGYLILGDGGEFRAAIEEALKNKTDAPHIVSESD